MVSCDAAAPLMVTNKLNYKSYLAMFSTGNDEYRIHSIIAVVNWNKKEEYRRV